MRAVSGLALEARRAWLSAKEKTLLGGAVVMGPRRPELALTFEDGPDASWTPAILDILAARRVKATFFLLGIHVEREPELARRVAGAHEIGCHSYGHVRSGVTSLEAFRADVARFRAVAERELGTSP